MKKIIIIFCFIPLFLNVACEGEIDPLQFAPEGELRYPGKANDAKYFAGRNRLQIQFTLGSDPNVNKAIIYWNLLKDSVVVDVDRNKLEENRVEVLIEDLPENIYNFEIYTYDKFENKSVPTHLIGRTYGSRYETVISNRPIKNCEAVNSNGDIKLIWGDSVLYSSGVRVIYTDLEHTKKVVDVSNIDNETVLEQVAIESEVEIITLFAPEPNAIDIFESKQTIKIEVEKLKLPVKKPYAYLTLPGDAPAEYIPNSWNNLWDGRAQTTWKGYGEISYSNFTTTGSHTAESIWATIDVGQPIDVARIRADYYYYKEGTAPKILDLLVYTGKGVPPSLEIENSDYWKDWILIHTFDNSDPNEYPFDVNDAATSQIGFAKGLDASFEYQKVPKAQYFRLKCRAAWTPWNQNSKNFSLSEITFWTYMY